MSLEGRWYSQNSRAWYAHVLADMSGSAPVSEELLVGCSDEPAWELGLRWYGRGDETPVLRLEVYYDAFSAFTSEPQLLAGLAELSVRATPTPTQVVALLDRLGFADRTDTRTPTR